LIFIILTIIVYKQLSICLEVPSVCGTERDDCDKDLATCTDIESGLYQCACNDGYVGNGKKCIGKFQPPCQNWCDII
jgi:hypothetical protein